MGQMKFEYFLKNYHSHLMKMYRTIWKLWFYSNRTINEIFVDRDESVLISDSLIEDFLSNK